VKGHTRHSAHARLIAPFSSNPISVSGGHVMALANQTRKQEPTGTQSLVILHATAAALFHPTEEEAPEAHNTTMCVPPGEWRFSCSLQTNSDPQLPPPRRPGIMLYRRVPVPHPPITYQPYSPPQTFPLPIKVLLIWLKFKCLVFFYSIYFIVIFFFIFFYFFLSFLD
jgi:hypothetical protein